jgi:hypothetical protein
MAGIYIRVAKRVGRRCHLIDINMYGQQHSGTRYELPSSHLGLALPREQGRGAPFCPRFNPHTPPILHPQSTSASHR